MKRLFISFLALLAIGVVRGQKPLPVYLDETKSLDQRIEDALRRMTLDEKIRIISMAPVFARIINKVYNYEPISIDF